MKKVYLLSAFTLFAILSFGQQVYLMEDFSGNLMPPTGWSIDGLTGQWSISGSANAGGTSPEAKFTYINQVSSTRFISPEIDLTGVSSVTFMFNFMYDWYGTGAPVFGVATRSGGGDWRSAWEIAPTGNVGPETKILEWTTGIAHPDF
jgi:hypothetical protein